MMEYLEKLVEDREYDKALAYAEQLLLNREVQPNELMVINCMMARARVMKTEFHGAIISGVLSLRLAKDLEEWDYHGLSCLALSASYIMLRQFAEASDICYEYLAYLPMYSKASSQFEVRIWYNLGIIHNRLGNGHEAIRSLHRAVEAARRLENDRDMHRVRHALIGAHLVTQDYRAVPGLLAKCLKYLRNNAQEPGGYESKLWHFVLRSEFGLATNRLSRADLVANHGLRLASGYPRHQFQFHLILSRIAYVKGQLKQALGHTLSARVYAIRCHRFDLETEASELMYELATKQPGVLGELGPEHMIPALEPLAIDSGTNN